MKVFSWLQRRLHTSTEYCRVSQKKDVAFGGHGDEKEDAAAGDVETDSKALLLHNVLDGILTIGTLGHDPHHTLLPFPTPSPRQCHSLEEDQEVIKVAVALTEDTLLVAKRSQLADAGANGVERSVVMVVTDDKKMTVEKVEVCQARNSNGQLLEPLLKEDREKKEKGRTTLADLFAAANDAEASKESAPTFARKKASTGATSGAAQNPACRAKHGGKIARQEKGKDSSPLTTTATKKINQLIKRMVKKKIHPAEAVRARGEAEPLVRAATHSVMPVVHVLTEATVCEAM